MFRVWRKQGPRRGSILIGAAILALALAGCGDDDAGSESDTSVVATTQSSGDEGTAPVNQEPSGATGVATVTVPEGTFELTLDEACVLSEIGISALASSDSTSLMIAGPAEIAVVVVELSGGDQWAAAAANVEIDGTTMSYVGPATGPGGSAEISVHVDCG